jgi:hypothetical protein
MTVDPSPITLVVSPLVLSFAHVLGCMDAARSPSSVAMEKETRITISPNTFIPIISLLLIKKMQIASQKDLQNIELS